MEIESNNHAQLIAELQKVSNTEHTLCFKNCANVFEREGAFKYDKIDPPEEDPCKCCDPISNKNLECGEHLVNTPAIGASKLFDNIQEDVSNRNQLSLENEPVNAFADVQTTEDMNMNKVVPYEAIWDVDVLNHK